MAEGSRVADLLEDRPDLEAALEDVLAVDRASATWEFDDVPVDSGAFGELVSRGVVESVDGGYRLVDADAVSAALGGGESGVEPEPPDSAVTSRSLPGVNRHVVTGLVGVLGLVVAVRLVPWSSVFPGEHVVLTGNDPYFYRYWVEQSITSAGGPSGPVAPGFTTGEPLLVAALAVISGLLGGVAASGAVLAWYPVVSAAVTGLLLYGLTVRISRDRRVGLAAVALLAVTPGHALRTSLGFADHHAFDYVFLAVTATALVWLATRSEEDTHWTLGLATLGLGIGVAGQVLAWNAGPLLLGAVALAVVVQVLVAVRAGRPPASRHAPILAGLGLGATLSLTVHVAWGWQSEVVAASPALVFGGALAVVLAGELAHRRGRSVRDLAALEAGVGILAVVTLWLARPDYWTELLGGVGRITETGSQIAEMQALISTTTLGSLTVLGFLLFVALPPLAWASAHLWRGTADTDRWAVAAAFAWYFLGLSLFQVRFVGEFAPFVALFAALGFVWLAARVDLTTAPRPFAGDDLEWLPSRPSTRTAVAVVALFVLVGGMGAVQAPVKISQLTIEDATYETAIELEAYADGQGWAGADERYVFSEWGRNRVYNYFVSGESRSYGYAQSNYVDFATSTNPGQWYDRLAGRAAFVVTSDRLDTGDETLHTRLHERLGSADGATAGLGHYRAIYVTADRSRAAFTLVPGARLVGTGPVNATVTATTTVDVGTAETTYERRATANATGAVALRVAHPGTYEVVVGGETTQVTVPEQAVRDGADVFVTSE